MAKPVLTLPTTAKPSPIAEPAPHLGAAVIVKTTANISGQNEHAAIITKVIGEDLVNVMLMPAEGQPYSILSINRATGSPSWRWPRS